MIKFVNYVILLLIVFVLYKIVYFLVNKYLRLRYERNCYETYLRYKDLGSIVAVEGKVGSGKSTLVSLFSQYHNLYVQNELISMMNSLSEKVSSFPFKTFNNLLDLLPNENLDLEIKDLINKFDDQYLINDIYYDYQNYYTNKKLIYDYAICYFHYKRENYVLSDISIFNQIKGNFSKQFDVAWLKVKETNNFPIDDYSLLINDETLLFNSNVRALKKLNEDSGEDMFLRLIRNASSGTIRFIGTMQDVTRWQKNQRELTSTIISVEESYLVGSSKSFLRKIERKRKFYKVIYKIFIKLKNDPFYEEKENFFRKKLKQLRIKEDKHINSSFIRFNCAIYNKVENVGKKITEELEDRGNYYVSFYGPVNYCWGNLDTYYFKPVFEYLRNISVLKSRDLEETKIDLQQVINLLQKNYDEVQNDPSIINEEDW